MSKMFKRPNLTEEQKYLIIFLNNENGLCPEEIAKRDELKNPITGKPIQIRTVRYWIKRYQETGSINVKDRIGRPRILTSKVEKEVIKGVKSNSMESYKFINEKLKLDMNVRTLNDYGLRNGIRSYSALNKPGLSKQHKLNRLNYVTERLEKKDGNSIIFLDEKMFKHVPDHNLVKVKRRKNERYDEKNVNFTKPKNSNKSVNCLIWIGSQGFGNVYCAEHCDDYNELGEKISSSNSPYRGFDNKSFLKLLENNIIPDIRSTYGNEFKLMMDNSPVHNKMNDEKTKQLVDVLLEKEGIERVI